MRISSVGRTQNGLFRVRSERPNSCSRDGGGRLRDVEITGQVQKESGEKPVEETVKSTSQSYPQLFACRHLHVESSFQVPLHAALNAIASRVTREPRLDTSEGSTMSRGFLRQERFPVAP